MLKAIHMNGGAGGEGMCCTLILTYSWVIKDRVNLKYLPIEYDNQNSNNKMYWLTNVYTSYSHCDIFMGILDLPAQHNQSLTICHKFMVHLELLY
jgi:hypothetical protein